MFLCRSILVPSIKKERFDSRARLFARTVHCSPTSHCIALVSQTLASPNRLEREAGDQLHRSRAGSLSGLHVRESSERWNADSHVGRRAVVRVVEDVRDLCSNLKTA